MRRYRSSTGQRRVAWTARNIDRVTQHYRTASLDTSPTSSQVRLSGKGLARCVMMADDRTKHDMEHYLRLAQNVLDEGLERRGEILIDMGRERPNVREEELVSRAMASASRLARDLVRLSTWLEQATGRKAGVTGGKRGAERVRRRHPT